jgi:hypothetical protein
MRFGHGIVDQVTSDVRRTMLIFSYRQWPQINQGHKPQERTWPSPGLRQPTASQYPELGLRAWKESRSREARPEDSSIYIYIYVYIYITRNPVPGHRVAVLGTSKETLRAPKPDTVDAPVQVLATNGCQTGEPQKRHFVPLDPCGQTGEPSIYNQEPGPRAPGGRSGHLKRDTSCPQAWHCRRSRAGFSNKWLPNRGASKETLRAPGSLWPNWGASKATLRAPGSAPRALGVLRDARYPKINP